VRAGKTRRSLARLDGRSTATETAIPRGCVVIDCNPSMATRDWLNWGKSSVPDLAILASVEEIFWGRGDHVGQLRQLVSQVLIPGSGH
jgi:hypothetical protein